MELVEKKKIKPAVKGAKIPNPKTGFFLKEDGEMVTMSKYWRRLYSSKQVVDAVETKSEPKKVLKNKEDKNKKGNE